MEGEVDYIIPHDLMVHIFRITKRLNTEVTFWHLYIETKAKRNANKCFSRVVTFLLAHMLTDVNNELRDLSIICR